MVWSSWKTGRNRTTAALMDAVWNFYGNERFQDGNCRRPFFPRLLLISPHQALANTASWWINLVGTNFWRSKTSWIRMVQCGAATKIVSTPNFMVHCSRRRLPELSDGPRWVWLQSELKLPCPELELSENPSSMNPAARSLCLPPGCWVCQLQLRPTWCNSRCQLLPLASLAITR
jgi:hypothetical protein